MLKPTPPEYHVEVTLPALAMVIAVWGIEVGLPHLFRFAWPFAILVVALAIIGHALHWLNYSNQLEKWQARRKAPPPLPSNRRKAG